MEDGNITSWIDTQVGEFGRLQDLNLHYCGTSDSDRKDVLIDGVQLQWCQIPNGLLIEGFIPVRLYLSPQQTKTREEHKIIWFISHE